VAGVMHPGLHGTTFGGGPLACAVAIEFLQQLDGLRGHISKIGKYFLRKLQALQETHSSIRAVRGIGLMLAADLDSPDTAKGVVSKLLENGFVINRTHDTVLRFLPPYVIEATHIDRLIAALDAALAESTAAETQKRTRIKLRGANN